MTFSNPAFTSYILGVVFVPLLLFFLLKYALKIYLFILHKKIKKTALKLKVGATVKYRCQYNYKHVGTVIYICLSRQMVTIAPQKTNKPHVIPLVNIIYVKN